MRFPGAATCAAFIGALALSASATSALAQKWDMPMAYPATNFHSENAKDFAACVKSATGGKIDIALHPGGSLFNGNDIKRAVQTGQAPIGERLISAHANENPLYGIDSVPFLATSFADSDRLWKAARGKLEAVLDKQNLVYVYAVPWPPQGLYFKKPIASVADMKGIKFRAYNAATARLAALTGMAPVQIEAAELSQALATGVAESFISSGSTGVDSKVWQQLTHFYDTQAWLPRNVVFANKDAWGKLDAATQSAIKGCGDKAAESGTKKSAELTAGYLKTLADNGMKVQPPSDALKAELAKIGQTMTEEWLKNAGADGKAIVDAFNAN
ncbi:MAG: TRAP transporter substrate-binding protein [Methylobacteriaceae bacterium]|nr:TRAP transporter substrate-binding protein [Methylobacteriaceae bacterium]